MCQIKPKRQIISCMVFFILLVASVVLSCSSFGSDEKILFPQPGNSTASSQMRMLCKAFPTDLSEPMWEWGWNWTQVLPSPPPKKNKTKQNKNEKTKKPCIETIRLYIKRRFFKYAISTGIVWYNFKLDFLIHREIWRLNRETVRWRPKPWNCWSSNSQIQ